jgi:hypothetical protein
MATATTDIKAPTRTKEDLQKLVEEGSTNPKVFEELMAINKSEETKKIAKSKTVKELVKSMADHGITFLDLKTEGAPVPDLDKMFDAATIKLVAAPYFAKAGNKPAKSTDDTPKESKRLLIALPSNGKRPAGYGKGDTLGTYTKAAFKELFTKQGDKFESVMEGLKTPEGKEFYATPQGKKEWTAIIDHIKTKKIAPKAAK